MVRTMPCNCPEDRPARPNPAGGCNYLVCSNGSVTSLYRLVEQAIPDVPLAHGRPVVHPDGSLTFTTTPPSIPGYRPEGMRLYPAWPPCVLRMLQVQVVDQVLNMAGICGNPEAGQFSMEVAPDHCQNCPARQTRA